MPNAILVLVIVLALMLWMSVFAVLQRRKILGETPGPQPPDDNTLQGRFRVLERAFAGVIEEDGFDTGTDEVCPSNGRGQAKVYLRRVVALCGAAQTEEGYILSVGKTRFYVRDRYVRRLRDSTNPQCGCDETCFYCVHKGMPREEEIAGALLQLKNNPLLFNKWAMKNGLAFKANGQVFTHGL